MEILTCSAREYVDSVGKGLCDYNLRGVSDALHGRGLTSIAEEMGAEVVTNLIVCSHGSALESSYGTALIPKKK